MRYTFAEHDTHRMDKTLALAGLARGTVETRRYRMALANAESHRLFAY